MTSNSIELTARENNVYQTMLRIYEETRYGTNKTFAQIFGEAGGDGNVWNMLRKKGWLSSNDNFKYIWMDPILDPTPLSARLIAKECAEYVKDKKNMRDKARESMAVLNKWAMKSKEVISSRGGRATITMDNINILQHHFDVLTEYMNRNERLPNPDYDGVGSV